MADPGNQTPHDDLLRESESLQRRMVVLARDLDSFAQRLNRMTQGLCEEVRTRRGEGSGDDGSAGT